MNANDKKNAIKSLQTMLRSIKYSDANLNLKEFVFLNLKTNKILEFYIYISIF